MNNFFVLILVILNLFILNPAAWASKAKPFQSQEEADSYLLANYNLGCKYYNEEAWRTASDHFEKVIHFFPTSDAAADASYFLGVCYFQMKEFDFANKMFSNYLAASSHPAYFEDAIRFKFCIAEYFKLGKKRHIFNFRYFPKCISANDLALTIYDEIVVALPNSELSIQALFSKADLYRQMREFRLCVDTYQTIIRRFPKHEIVPICYLKISETYLQQSRYEFQNPDVIALAELNLRKFREDFPRDESLLEAENNLSCIKELYAKGLCDLGLFYERMDEPGAAAIYYQSAIEEFPETKIARYSRRRLLNLGYSLPVSEEQTDSSQVEKKETPLEANCVEALSLSQNIEKIPNEQYLIADITVDQNQLLALNHGTQNENGHEFTHYSLMKSKERTSEKGWRGPEYDQLHENTTIDRNAQQVEIDGVLHGDLKTEMPPKPFDDESSHQLWHYSLLKERENDAPHQH